MFVCIFSYVILCSYLTSHYLNVQPYCLRCCCRLACATLCEGNAVGSRHAGGRYADIATSSSTSPRTKAGDIMELLLGMLVENLKCLF